MIGGKARYGGGRRPWNGRGWKYSYAQTLSNLCSILRHVGERVRRRKSWEVAQMTILFSSIPHFLQGKRKGLGSDIHPSQGSKLQTYMVIPRLGGGDRVKSKTCDLMSMCAYRTPTQAQTTKGALILVLPNRQPSCFRFPLLSPGHLLLIYAFLAETVLPMCLSKHYILQLMPTLLINA